MLLTKLSVENYSVSLKSVLRYFGGYLDAFLFWPSWHGWKYIRRWNGCWWYLSKAQLCDLRKLHLGSIRWQNIASKHGVLVLLGRKNIVWGSLASICVHQLITNLREIWCSSGAQNTIALLSHKTWPLRHKLKFRRWVLQLDLDWLHKFYLFVFLLVWTIGFGLGLTWLKAGFIFPYSLEFLILLHVFVFLLFPSFVTVTAAHNSKQWI